MHLRRIRGDHSNDGGRLLVQPLGSTKLEAFLEMMVGGIET